MENLSKTQGKDSYGYNSTVCDGVDDQISACGRLMDSGGLNSSFTSVRTISNLDVGEAAELFIMPLKGLFGDYTT